MCRRQGADAGNLEKEGGGGLASDGRGSGRAVKRRHVGGGWELFGQRRRGKPISLEAGKIRKRVLVLCHPLRGISNQYPGGPIFISYSTQEAPCLGFYSFLPPSMPLIPFVETAVMILRIWALYSCRASVLWWFIGIASSFIAIVVGQHGFPLTVLPGCHLAVDDSAYASPAMCRVRPELNFRLVHIISPARGRRDAGGANMPIHRILARDGATNTDACSAMALANLTNIVTFFDDGVGRDDRRWGEAGGGSGGGCGRAAHVGGGALTVPGRRGGVSSSGRIRVCGLGVRHVPGGVGRWWMWRWERAVLEVASTSPLSGCGWRKVPACSALFGYAGIGVGVAGQVAVG
ncbi:hypothetical protein C8J57DRAFT_1230278 [Mycena rebaudengoi]|nr:hypothetical protein C8J57DRAFT_1230278 [Mycena rebaudengoi]